MKDQRIMALVRKIRGGRTQTQFAKMLGTKQGSVSYWESGKSLPTGTDWCRLGNVATDPADRMICWEKAGIDLSVLAGANVAPLGEALLNDVEALFAQHLQTTKNALNCSFGELMDQLASIVKGGAL